MKKILMLFSSLIISLTLISCGHKSKQDAPLPAPPKSALTKLSSTLVSKSGSKVKASVEFTQVENSVMVKLAASGFEPKGQLSW